MASTRSSKRKRTDGGSSSEARGDVDDFLRLCPDFASLVGRKYVKRSELSREAMMSYLQSTGAVKSVELVRVRVEQFGGDEFDVVTDDKANKVTDLKKAIQEEQGTKSWHQSLFLLRRGGEAVEASEEPLADSVAVHDGDRMALCVVTEELLLQQAGFNIEGLARMGGAQANVALRAAGFSGISLARAMTVVHTYAEHRNIAGW